jgi:hypothetical protein
MRERWLAAALGIALAGGVIVVGLNAAPRGAGGSRTAPPLVGLSGPAAVGELAAIGIPYVPYLSPGLTSRARIIGQYPPAGTSLSAGQPVHFYVANCGPTMVASGVFSLSWCGTGWPRAINSTSQPRPF